MQEALAIKGAGLESSFLVKTNPFDPSDPSQTPLEFSYELPSDATVEFRIFTLTGEKVYAKDYTSGSEGGRAGENFVYWDGRNEEGVTVFNGVYIVSVRNADTDEHARLKLAVVK
jgi:flagellar hook assembly protein FlgD